MRNPHPLLPISILAAALLLFSIPALAQDAPAIDLSPSGPQIPKGLGKTCQTRQEDVEDIKHTYKNGSRGYTSGRPASDEERAPGECYKKIIENYNNCATIQKGVGMSDDGGGSVKGAAAQMKINTAQGVAQNTEKAHDCKKQKEDATKKCKELKDQTKQAWEDNNKQEREYMAEDHPAAEKQEMKERFHKTSLQLQAQMRNTQELIESQENALDNFSQCFSDEATRAQIIHDYSASQENSATGDIAKEAGGQGAKNAGGTLVEKGKEQAIDTVKDHIKERGKETLKSAFGDAAENAEKRALAGGIGLGTEGAASTATSTLGTRAAQFAGNVVTKWGAADLVGVPGALLGSTEPANTCSAIYTNAFAANAEGCSLSTQSVMNTLNGH